MRRAPPRRQRSSRLCHQIIVLPQKDRRQQFRWSLKHLGGRVQRQLDFGDRERFPRILRRHCGMMLEPARVINYLMTNSFFKDPLTMPN
jgi:hypothetical protein